MKKSKQTSAKNKSSFNLRRRKLNIGASLHMLPSNLELHEEYQAKFKKQTKPKKKISKHNLYSRTDDGLNLGS